tara:strand:- start:110 stop:823 length:714 start_codon:yes stop_codon:yes gene_type:complete
MMDNNSIKITYESLFELLRNEKNKEEIQTLDKDFFNNVVEYLEEKKNILNRPDDNLFVKNEKKKTEQQLINIKKIIKDLLQRREKKIISMALIQSRTEAKIDLSNILEEEKIMFNKLIKLFNNFTKYVLNNLLESKIPDIQMLKQTTKEKEETKEDGNKKEISEPDSDGNQNQVSDKSEITNKDDNSMIRFIQYVPTFVSPELHTYGPFEPEDMACLPKKIVNLLVEKKAAEEICIK